MNFWPGRCFKDFEDLTRQAIIWRNQTANSREHRTTRRVVRLQFESQEKPALMALNPTAFDTDEIFSRNVSSDFHLQYESNRYSVPWTLVGMTVTVRVNSRDLKIYYNEKFICSHPRSYLKNQVFTIESHRSGLLERKPGATRENWQLSFVKSLGARMAEYVELVRQGPRSLKYELSRLIALVTVYGEPMVLDACAECLKAGIVGVDSVELYLKRRHHPSSVELNPEPMTFESEKLNRIPPAVDLRKYDALLFEVDHSRSASERNEDGYDNHEPGDDAPAGRSRGVEAQALEPGHERGSDANERARKGHDLTISHELDIHGKSGTAHADDSKSGQVRQVQETSDSGELRLPALKNDRKD